MTRENETTPGDIVARLNDACVGHPAARIPWPHRLLHDARDEIVRLRRGWLRVIQQENSCPATGGGCLAKRCGCVAEMEMLANEQS